MRQRFDKDRVSKCRCRCDGLRPSVERPISDAHVLRPGRNQAPAHGCELANLAAFFLADREDGLCRRNVVSRTILNFITGRLKAVGNVLLRVRQSVSVTHQLNVADYPPFVGNAESYMRSHSSGP